MHLCISIRPRVQIQWDMWRGDMKRKEGLEDMSRGCAWYQQRQKENKECSYCEDSEERLGSTAFRVLAGFDTLTHRMNVRH